MLFLMMPALQSCEEDGGGTAGGKEPAADFSLALFDGGNFRLSDYRGSPVIVNFFASWCVPCKVEAPVLEKAFQDYGDDGVAVVGIAIQDTETKAKDFVEELGLTYPAGLDADSTIKEAYGVFGLPMTYFIDKAGLINYTHIGVVTEDLLRYELEKIL